MPASSPPTLLGGCLREAIARNGRADDFKNVLVAQAVVLGVSQERDDFIKLVEAAGPAVYHQQGLWGAAGGQLGGLHMDEVDVQSWGDRVLSGWGRGRRPAAGEAAVLGLGHPGRLRPSGAQTQGAAASAPLLPRCPPTTVMTIITIHTGWRRPHSRFVGALVQPSPPPCQGGAFLWPVHART